MKETETLELKKSTSELRQAIISIGAILNKHQSGKIIFGIKDNGEVLGQDISKNTIRDMGRNQPKTSQKPAKNQPKKKDKK